MLSTLTHDLGRPFSLGVFSRLCLRLEPPARDLSFDEKLAKIRCFHRMPQYFSLDETYFEKEIITRDELMGKIGKKRGKISGK